jgi:iron-sulfur cluster assembly protein
VKTLMQNTDSRYVKVSLKNKGCSGLSYSLDYTNTKDKFDEEVKQDGR